MKKKLLVLLISLIFGIVLLLGVDLVQDVSYTIFYTWGTIFILNICFFAVWLFLIVSGRIDKKNWYKLEFNEHAIALISIFVLAILFGIIKAISPDITTRRVLLTISLIPFFFILKAIIKRLEIRKEKQEENNDSSSAAAND